MIAYGRPATFLKRTAPRTDSAQSRRRTVPPAAGASSPRRTCWRRLPEGPEEQRQAQEQQPDAHPARFSAQEGEERGALPSQPEPDLATTFYGK